MFYKDYQLKSKCSKKIIFFVAAYQDEENIQLKLLFIIKPVIVNMLMRLNWYLKSCLMFNSILQHLTFYKRQNFFN